MASASRYGASGSVPTLRAVFTSPDSTSRQNGSSATRHSPRREQTLRPSELSVRIVGRNPAVRSRSWSAAITL